LYYSLSLLFTLAIRHVKLMCLTQLYTLMKYYNKLLPDRRPIGRKTDRYKSSIHVWVNKTRVRRPYRTYYLYNIIPPVYCVYRHNDDIIIYNILCIILHIILLYRCAANRRVLHSYNNNYIYIRAYNNMHSRTCAYI